MATRTPPDQPSSIKWVALSWIAVGSVFGILFILIFFAPAQWLSDYVADASEDRILLMAPQGTVWNGSAQVKLGAGKGSLDQAALSGRLLWKLRPSWQGFVLTLQAECCISKPWDWLITAGLQGPRINISDINQSEPMIWPSALLSGLGTPWNTLELQGNLSLSTQQLAFQWSQGQWDLVGHAQLDATNMSTSLSTIKPIGSYRFMLHGGQSPYLQLSTLEGSLQMKGTGRWVNRKLNFVGEAKAQSDRADALANLLNIIGIRDGERVIIKI